MSTQAEKLKAQARAFGMAEAMQVGRHLIGPAELGALFDRVEQVTKQRDQLLVVLAALLSGDFQDKAWEAAHKVVADVKGAQ